MVLRPVFLKLPFRSRNRGIRPPKGILMNKTKKTFPNPLNAKSIRKPKISAHRKTRARKISITFSKFRCPYYRLCATRIRKISGFKFGSAPLLRTQRHLVRLCCPKSNISRLRDKKKPIILKKFIIAKKIQESKLESERLLDSSQADVKETWKSHG